VVSTRHINGGLDLETNRVMITGQLVVGEGGPVRDLRVCAGGNCKPVAEGRQFAVGETVGFALEKGPRPSKLIVECVVIGSR
jgi:hypothetical protein